MALSQPSRGWGPALWLCSHWAGHPPTGLKGAQGQLGVWVRYTFPLPQSQADQAALCRPLLATSGSCTGKRRIVSASTNLQVTVSGTARGYLL